MIFHWVFDGDDIYLRCIYFSQESVEGGGLSGAGRAGDQDESIWLFNFIFDDSKEIRLNTQILEFYSNSFRIKYTHHDGLTISAGDQRTPDTYLFFSFHDVKASILRYLGSEFHAGEKLDAGIKQVVYIQSEEVYILQHAIEPQTQSPSFFFRLYVYI